MQLQLIHKTTGGKLIRLQIEYGKYAIERVRITGDFFLHPEESVGDLEAALVNVSRDMEVERLQQKLDAALAIRSAELIGVDTKTLAGLIHEAVVPKDSINDLDY